MERLRDAATEILDRHPAPALAIEELTALVAREQPGSAPGPEALFSALRDASPEIRVIEADRARFAALGPRRWVIAPRGTRRGEFPRRSLGDRIRESVRTLGEAVEPGSTVALARWARLLYEEEKVRRIISRDQGRPSLRTRRDPPP